MRASVKNGLNPADIAVFYLEQFCDLPRPGALSALQSYVSCPNIQIIVIRSRMQRLHAGDYSKFPESRNVLGARVFNVLYPVPCI
jgi:hypothetical protein